MKNNSELLREKSTAVQCSRVYCRVVGSIRPTSEKRRLQKEENKNAKNVSQTQPYDWECSYATATATKQKKEAILISKRYNGTTDATVFKMM